MPTSRFLFSLAASAALALASTGVLVAQVAATLETGASRTTPSDGATISSGALGATISLLRPWTSAGAAFSWSRFADGGGRVAQFSAGASTFSSELVQRIRLEGAVSASMVDTEGGTAGRFAPTARLHLLGDAAGAWIGGSYGVGRGADSTQGVTTAELAGWMRRGSTSLTLLAVPTRLRNGLAYTDAALSARFEGDRFDVLGTLGGRRSGDTPSQSWANVSIAAWITDQLAVLASGGRYPDDPIQAFSSGRFVSLGLRIATRRPDRLVAATPRSAADLQIPRPDGPIGISVEPAGDAAERTLRVTAPGAERVALRGDATAWESVSMQKERAGVFVLRLALEAGPQHLVIRVDDGPWLIPAGTTRVEDEFGTASGLLVVP